MLEQPIDTTKVGPILAVSVGAGVVAWLLIARAQGALGGLGQEVTVANLTPLRMRYGGVFDKMQTIGWSGTGILYGPYFGPNAARPCNPMSGPICSSGFQTFDNECQLARVSKQLKRAGAGRYAPYALGRGTCEQLTNITAQQTTRAMTDGTFQVLF